MSAKKLTKKKKKEVYALYLEGLTLKEVAERHDMSQATISNFLRSKGVSRGKANLPEDKREEVYALYLEGLTQVEIAKRSGVSQGSVSNIIRANKTKTKTRPKAKKDFCVNGHEMKDPNLIYSTVIKRGETYRRRSCKTCSYAKSERSRALQRKKASLLPELIAESSKGHLLCKDCEPMLEEWLSKKLSGK
jgi:DNA-binding CsgD family transcriptional regulator